MRSEVHARAWRQWRAEVRATVVAPLNPAIRAPARTVGLAHEIAVYGASVARENERSP